ncbi:MAG: FKBP-type peptidyl-prolyl cis-trans isomerase [Proteiniphilum sp.]|jgi:FKBP-type peptidyl-prolyl cis-trans isomerase FklB|uniref:FKBP-type peptidyl-prolyl cis-trans isomerase n=1 Tax=Proteiniphilum sp. TaxID=1926877 RepID=UPI002B1FFFB2|nr:FKBP-type peptidyl-prolyl cis-trans isomerase [Proteiniphilum sp.]MEA5129089.1 FKBP-type peptidyl-prolyl cis-trans isomerase [Proteiniphilum sp.]
MKKTILGAFCAMTMLAVLMVSCGGASTPKTSLKNSVDSVSYAYGVSMAEQGLMQFLEQSGVLQGTSNIEYDYQMRIAAADSTQKGALQKEMAAKIDSVNKINAPRLNEFIRGLKEAMSLEEKSPYANGLSIGVQFSQQMLPQLNTMLYGAESTQKANNDQIMAGLISVLKNQQLAISSMDANALVQKEIEKAQEAEQARHEEELKVQYADSIAAGNAFLAENAKREGVVTLASGLQYEILREGNGATPTDTDRVKVHYHGTLINGEVFDSSVDRGEPSTFGVTQVIAGWTEALKLMPVGSKWKLYVPYNLAYGAQDRGTIKPFSNLIFEVELLGIE